MTCINWLQYIEDADSTNLPLFNENHKKGSPTRNSIRNDDTLYIIRTKSVNLGTYLNASLVSNKTCIQINQRLRHFTSPPKLFLGKAIGTEFLMMSNVRIFSFISVISIRVIHGVGINIFDDKFAKIAMCLPAIFNIRICN